MYMRWRGWYRSITQGEGRRPISWAIGVKVLHRNTNVLFLFLADVHLRRDAVSLLLGFCWVKIMPHTLLPWQKQRIELAADSTFIASYYGGT